MKTKVGEIFIQCNGANAGTPEDPSWHVKLIDVAETMEEAAQLGALKRERTLGMDACAKQGVRLPALMSEAVSEALALAEREKTARLETEDKLAELQNVNGILTQERNRALAAVTKLARAAGVDIPVKRQATVDNGQSAG